MLQVRYVLNSLWGALRVGVVIGVLLYFVCLTFGINLSFAGGRSRPAPEPTVVHDSPQVTASPDRCGLKDNPFVKLGLDIGPTVDRVFVQKALCLLNEAVANGCIRAKAIAWKNFKSFNTVFNTSPKIATEAIDEYLKGAPYEINPRWYYARFSKVIGYTYNFKDDDWDKSTSETRIWSNTKFIGSDPKPLAAHLAHELSHQARAGGYVHYTIFQGSFPYEIGDIAAACLAGL